MLVASLIGLSCGLFLGLRYKALVLVPVQGSGVLVTLLLVLFGQVGLHRAIVDLLCWSGALQFGYLGLMALALSPRFAARPQPGKAPQRL